VKADVVPSVAELDNFLLDYFTTNGEVYLAALQALQDNIFATTSAFTFSFNTNSQERPGGGDGASPTSTDTAKTAGIAVAAAAGGFVVLISAIMFARRRSAYEEDENLVKYVEEHDGHMTVAGETYAGETYAGTISLDSRSLHRTEEGGMSSECESADPSQWEGYAHYGTRTPQFRTSSPTGTSGSSEGHESDESESSDVSGETSSGVSSASSQRRKIMENVDL